MVLSPSYSNLFEDLVLDRAEDHYLFDINGERYFDLFSNFGCTNLGHHPEVVQAIKDQVSKLLIVMTSDFTNQMATQLARELVHLTKLNRVYWANSGAEANEAAIKLAHWNKKGFGMSFINAFHGRTLGILPHSSSKSIHRKGFQLNQSILIPFFGSSAALDWIEDVIFKKIADPSEISYLITEPVQIEGGVIVPEPDFLKKLRDLCSANQIQLIVDEVQTGFRRTGPMFACERFGIQPDIMTLGKAIASGLPLAAMLSSQMNWVEGSQGSTFGGSIVSCAAGIASLKLLKDLDISALERLIRSHLSELSDLVEVSGIGAIWAIKLPDPNLAERVRMSLYKQKILTIPCGTSSIRIEPPLTFNLIELDAILQTITREVKCQIK